MIIIHFHSFYIFLLRFLGGLCVCVSVRGSRCLWWCWYSGWLIGLSSLIAVCRTSCIWLKISVVMLCYIIYFLASVSMLLYVFWINIFEWRILWDKLQFIGTNISKTINLAKLRHYYKTKVIGIVGKGSSKGKFSVWENTYWQLWFDKTSIYEKPLHICERISWKTIDM